MKGVQCYELFGGIALKNHTFSFSFLYLTIVLLLLLYTQVFLGVQFMALCFSPCILSLCLPLLTHTLSYTIHLLMTCNYRCLLPLIEYLCYFTLCSHVLVMSKRGQLRTCLSLMTTRQNSCLSPLRELPTSITIRNAQIPFKQFVKNLGFTLDCHLTMNAHLSNIACTCCFELRRLASIRRFLTSTATATLVSAFVLSGIDYCNSLLFGYAHDVTSHLRRILNYAARVILRLPMSSSITTHLKHFIGFLSK